MALRAYVALVVEFLRREDVPTRYHERAHATYVSEIGIDLAETDYMSIGQLDDREITTSLGKRMSTLACPRYAELTFLQVFS